MPGVQWKRRNASSPHVRKSFPVLIDLRSFACSVGRKKRPSSAALRTSVLSAPSVVGSLPGN